MIEYIYLRNPEDDFLGSGCPNDSHMSGWLRNVKTTTVSKADKVNRSTYPKQDGLLLQLSQPMNG